MGNKPYGWVIDTGASGQLVSLADDAGVLAGLAASLEPTGLTGLSSGALLGGAGLINEGLGGGGSRLISPAGGPLVGPGPSAAFKDTTIVFSGDAALRYDFAAGGDPGAWQGIATSDPVVGPWCVPLKAGVQYRVQLSTRTDSIAGAPSYRVVFTHDLAGTLTSVKTIAFAAANAWQTDQFIFAVPAGALPNSRLAIQFQRGATAAQSFWVDSLRVQEIGQRYRCLLTNSNVTIVTLTTGVQTQVPWNQEQYDIGVLHDNVTNNTRITIPKGGDSGQWIFVAQANFAANATGRRKVAILKNGVEIAETQVLAADAAQPTIIQCVAADNDPLVGAFYEASVLQASGGNLALQGDGVTAASFFQATHTW